MAEQDEAQPGKPAHAESPRAGGSESGVASDAVVRKGLYAVAAMCMIGALLHVAFPTWKIDGDTIKLLGLAAIALVIREFSKIEIFGIGRLERAKEEVRQELRREVGGKAEEVRQELKKEIETEAGTVRQELSLALGEEKTGAPKRAGRRRRSRPATAARAGEASWDSDPNKGKFGGSRVSGGRALEAEIEPAAGSRSAACYVTIRVRSTEEANPLTGKVKFHLHPTFGNWHVYDVDVKDGVAEDTITSWGAFTIGAVADKGKTRLELDLADVKGGTRTFYEQ